MYDDLFLDTDFFAVITDYLADYIFVGVGIACVWFMVGLVVAWIDKVSNV